MVLPFLSCFRWCHVTVHRRLTVTKKALVMLPDEDLKKPLRVQFVGEEGIDEGGLQKEYFQVCAEVSLAVSSGFLKRED